MHFKENQPDSGQKQGPDPLRAPTMWAATGFDASVPGDLPGAPDASAVVGAAFDVCHVGVVLRVVVGVQAVVWLAALHGARDGMDWLSRAAVGSAEALPASLLWLVVLCAGRRWLARWPQWLVWAAAAALGGVAAMYGHVQMAWLAWSVGGAQPWALWPMVGPCLTGAAMALVGLAWLHQRHAKVLPQQTQARLVELQARIRPHFLFNTLNTAIALVQIDPDRAELFRRALVSPATESTLAQEIDLARRYLSIEQQRFGDRLSLSWIIDESVGDALVPTLLLQPLVENAVKYGVEADAQGGWVKVHTERKGDRVQVTVSNSLPAEGGAQVVTTRPGHGIALRNVKQRLLLMHDVQAQFEAGPRPVSPGASERCYVVRCSWPAGGAS
jgi:two-component system sensor histidine kinase AlgZ